MNKTKNTTKHLEFSYNNAENRQLSLPYSYPWLVRLDIDKVKTLGDFFR